MRIVTASDDKTARIWDAASGKEIAVLRGHQEGVNSAAFSPDGSRIVTSSGARGSALLGSKDNTARIWDAASGKEIAVLRGHTFVVTSAAFSPDGTRIVTASMDSTTRIWDAATGKEMAVLKGPVYSAAFSPDGTRIVTASGALRENKYNTARIWDAATGREIVVLRGAAAFSAAFSPDGTCIVTNSPDNTAHIWDAASGKEIAVLRGHQEGVNFAAFSPDGRRIVTASDDKTARIWHARVAAMSMKDLVVEVCTRRLRGLTTMSRDEMRLAGYPDAVPVMDACAGIE
jgi:WD40 repeat protein